MSVLRIARNLAVVLIVAMSVRMGVPAQRNRSDGHGKCLGTCLTSADCQRGCECIKTSFRLPGFCSK